MKTAVIMTDVVGCPVRAASVEAVVRSLGCDFIRVSPSDKPQDGASIVSIPESRLPQDGSSKEWHRCHLAYVEAAKLIEPADFYWCFEADVAAAPSTWASLIERTANRREHGLWTHLKHRHETPLNPWFTDQRTPEWADWYCLGALFRVSSDGMRVWDETAEETRELFTELAMPSLLARAGLSVGRINAETPHFYTCSTMMFNPHRSSPSPMRYRGMFSHPVKYDDCASGSRFGTGFPS